MNSTIQKLLLAIVFCCLSAGSACGSLIVGDSVLPMPSGIYPVSVSYNGDFTQDATGLSTTGNGNTLPDPNLPGTLPDVGFIYDATSHDFTVGNLADPNLTKHLWFHMEYTPGQNLPQSPGDTFDPSLWPTLTAPGGSVVNPTGASAINGHDIYMTWTITPQPDWETINLDFPGLNDDFGGVFLVEVKTACVPELSALCTWCVGILAVGYRWRRKLSHV